MIADSPGYLEIIDFIASGTTPEAVVQFRPSLVAQARIEDLIEREKAAHLSAEERTELDHYLELEHILRSRKQKPVRLTNSVNCPIQPTRPSPARMARWPGDCPIPVLC